MLIIGRMTFLPQLYLGITRRQRINHWRLTCRPQCSRWPRTGCKPSNIASPVSLVLSKLDALWQVLAQLVLSGATVSLPRGRMSRSGGK